MPEDHDHAGRGDARSRHFQWSKDGKRIQTVLLPDDGKRPMPKLGVATEPKVRIARDGKDPSRTYRYLLESPYQMHLLEHLLTGQLAIINVADGAVTTVGAPAMIRSVNAAPGENQFRVATVKKPFSYYTPFQRFGTTEGIWDREGKSLFTLSDRNLRETEPQPAADDRSDHRRHEEGWIQGRPNTAQPPKTDPRRPGRPQLAPAPFDPDGESANSRGERTGKGCRSSNWSRPERRK